MASVAVTGASTLSVSQDANFGNAPTIASPGKIVLNDGVLNVTTGFSLTALDEESRSAQLQAVAAVRSASRAGRRWSTRESSPTTAGPVR